MLIGVGNRWRRDDAAGLEVAQRLAAAAADCAVIAHEGDCTRLVDLLPRGDRVAIVDAARSGAAPGTIHRIDADAVDRGPALRSSTHAFGVADAIELARALGRLPSDTRVYAIEGARFDVGTGLSAAVELAVRALVCELADVETRRA